MEKTMSIKKVSLAGLVICFIYFIVTFVFVLTGYRNWLIAMEVVTILSGFFMVAFIVILPFSDNKKDYKLLAIVAVTSCMLLTSVAHIVNLAVTAPLIASGNNIPSIYKLVNGHLLKWQWIILPRDYLWD